MLCIVCLHNQMSVTHEGTGFCPGCFKIARPKEHEKLQGYRNKIAVDAKSKQEKKKKDQVERETARIAKEKKDNELENTPPVKKVKEAPKGVSPNESVKNLIKNEQEKNQTEG